MISWCIFLYIVGLLMVCLEIFIPGGIVGAVGVISIGSSFWMAYTRIDSVFGLYFVSIGLVFAMFCISISIKFFPRTRFSKRLFLESDESDFKSTSAELESLAGKEGTALTKLRPAGMAKIDGKRVSVVTEGAFLNKETEVKVVEVEGNRVVVRAKRKE